MTWRTCSMRWAMKRCSTVRSSTRCDVACRMSWPVAPDVGWRVATASSLRARSSASVLLPDPSMPSMVMRRPRGTPGGCAAGGQDRAGAVLRADLVFPFDDDFAVPDEVQVEDALGLE